MSEFTIKDSGKREQFESGMVRDTTEGKINYALVLDGPMLGRWAAHLTKGAAKYEPRNWMKAEGEAELARFKESAFRHFMQWIQGYRDEDHAAAVFFNINGAEYVLQKLQETLKTLKWNEPESKASRYFRAKGGFRDSTASIEIQDNTVYRVTADGLRVKADNWTVEEVEKRVARGEWIETERSHGISRYFRCGVVLTDDTSTATVYIKLRSENGDYVLVEGPFGWPPVWTESEIAEQIKEGSWVEVYP